MDKQLSPYEEKQYTYGRVWTALLLMMMLAVPLAICVYYNAWPPLTAVLKALLGVAPMYWLVGIIEVLTYVPMLGTGGTYLGFVTGNLTNLKVPCALNAMQAAKVKAGTEEGEVISTIAIASSSIVTVVVIAIGVFGLRLLEPVLESPVLKPAFDNILPSLFGALGNFLTTNRLAQSDVERGVLTGVGALIAIGAARLLYRKGMIGTEKESGNK